MPTRVQVILDPEERESFRALARRDGLSLSAWLRQAGRERASKSRVRQALDSPEALSAFFAECDAREAGREPDWSEHLAVLERSKLGG